MLQAVRAIEVLEHIGTAQAHQILNTLAQGMPEARVTRETKAALERLRSNRPETLAPNDFRPARDANKDEKGKAPKSAFRELEATVPVTAY